jgi:hypothetical protein
MSDELTFDQVLRYLQNDPNPSNRAEAAKILGEFVGDLSDEEYMVARQALNNALADAHPQVVMAAMNSLTTYDREGKGKGKHIVGEDFEIHGDTPEDLGVAPPEKAACNVCGRPEVLIPDGGCDRDDCPYK